MIVARCTILTEMTMKIAVYSDVMWRQVSWWMFTEVLKERAADLKRVCIFDTESGDEMFLRNVYNVYQVIRHYIQGDNQYLLHIFLQICI
jgi:hypothetical protein